MTLKRVNQLISLPLEGGGGLPEGVGSVATFLGHEGGEGVEGVEGGGEANYFFAM